MVLNKKAMVFTLVTITLLSIFAISYGSYNLIKDRTSINKRINTLNNFVNSVETDLPRQLFVSGYRTIFILNKEILDSGDYINDTNNSVNELFFDSKLDGVKKDLMDDANFTKIQNDLSINANKINAEISLLNPTLEITQDDPWNLKFILNITLIITDKAGLASWNRTASIISYIPTETLLDPFYSVGTSGTVTNKVIQTPYTTFVSGGDDTNLTDHFQNSYYKASASAPNYLQRLEGDFSADPNGVESLFYPDNLPEGINAKTKSVIDYIYFSTSDYQDYTISGITNLILDDEDNHLALYNVTDIATPI